MCVERTEVQGFDSGEVGATRIWLFLFISTSHFLQLHDTSVKLSECVCTCVSVWLWMCVRDDTFRILDDAFIIILFSILDVKLLPERFWWCKQHYSDIMGKCIVSPLCCSNLYDFMVWGWVNNDIIFFQLSLFNNYLSL